MQCYVPTNTYLLQEKLEFEIYTQGIYLSAEIVIGFFTY